MDEQDVAQRFEEERPRLRAVALRMLGSSAEAEDAVQETWLRLSRTGTAQIDNLPAWLTTVLSRICLDLLRSRTARREDPIDDRPEAAGGPDPLREAELGDAVGAALLVVLDTLSPAERRAPAGRAPPPLPGRAAPLRAARPVRPALRRGRLGDGPLARRGAPARQPR